MDVEKNSDSEDDLPVNNFKVKVERPSDEEEDDDLEDEEQADLNMTVEVEGENNSFITRNKIIIGQTKNVKTSENFSMNKLAEKTNYKQSEESDVDDDDEQKPIMQDEVSSSDTDGEIPTKAIAPPSSRYFKSFKFGPSAEFAHINRPEITDGFGEPLAVVTIKQEYNEDEDMYVEESYNEPLEEESVEMKEEPGIKTKRKNKKIKKEFTQAELTEMNVKLMYTCQMCPLEFGDCAELSAHVNSHDQVGTYLCRLCERVYQNIDDLRLHMMCHLRSGAHSCEECGKTYHHSQSLMAHRKRWHSQDRPFSCLECGKSFSLKNDLTTHSKAHSQERFPCTFCAKEFRTDRYLRIHTKHVHLGHKFITSECEICHKQFQKKNLMNHMKSHEEKVHKCHYCGKCMTTSYSLVAHIRRHEGVKPFVCEICNKGFVDKGKLSRHVHSHKGTRDFQCDMCEKSFSESQYLRQHKRTHDQNREFSCRICDLKFKSMNSVWSHMRKHTHTDRYECHFCGKTCYRPDHLRSHLISHTGIKDFQCEICSKRFAKSYDLTEHRRSHSGERPYHCQLCQRSFARHGEFRKHKMSKYHREREAESLQNPAVTADPQQMAATVQGTESSLPIASSSLQQQLLQQHSCAPCDKNFSTAPGLQAHMRRKSHLAKMSKVDN